MAESYFCIKSIPSSLSRDENLLRKLLTGLLVKEAFFTKGSSLYPGQMLSFGVPNSFIHKEKLFLVSVLKIVLNQASTLNILLI